VRAEVLVIRAITIERLRAGRAARQPAPAQVPNPPVQLPPVAKGLWNLVAAAFAAQSSSADDGPCVVDVAMSSAVVPSAATVGEQVDFTYVVRNSGTVPLAQVQVDSALPSGLDFVSASAGGALDPATGYVAWSMPTGLPAGGTTTLSLAAAVSGSGALTNVVCSAGADTEGIEVSYCASATVAVGVPTPTLTPTPTPTLTLTLTPTVVATPLVAGTPTATPNTPTPAATSSAVGTATAVRTPTVVSTQTPSVPTATPPPPTATPQPTATSAPTPTPEPPPDPEPPAPAPAPAPEPPPDAPDATGSMPTD
jgi:uncharacterized repeat protein (TIGR01451 family)